MSPWAAGLTEDRHMTWEEWLRTPESDPAPAGEPGQARRPGIVHSGPGTLNIVTGAFPGSPGPAGRSDAEVQVTARDGLNISGSVIGRADHGAAEDGGRHDSSILITAGTISICRSAIGSGARVTIRGAEVVASTDAGAAGFEAS
jgi:hypothetical protein